jgi:hypothetical protein
VRGMSKIMTSRTRQPITMTNRPWTLKRGTSQAVSPSR